MCKGNRPNPSLGSLGAGWDTTGVRGLDWGFGEKLAGIFRFIRDSVHVRAWPWE